MPPSSSTIKYEKRDGVAWVTLNRPEAMNAFNTEIRNALGDALAEATDDKDILAVVLTGEGGRAFSAGMDLKEMTQRDHTVGTSAAATGGRSGFGEVQGCPKPVIAAIDGHCLAAGLEVACLCDIRIATEKSTFGLPEPRRSLLPGPGLDELTRLIPLGDALLIQLTGSPIPAKRAYDIGLIQALVPDRAALFVEAERIAHDITLCAPLAVEAIKRIVKTGRNLPVEYATKFTSAIREQINKTEDRLEGPRAFAEKRPPVWKRR